MGGFGTVPDTRCCWGGDQGSDACFRQTRSASCGAAGNFQEANFCRNKGIPSSKCVSTSLLLLGSMFANSRLCRKRIAAISQLAADSLAPRARTVVMKWLVARTVILRLESFFERLCRLCHLLPTSFYNTKQLAGVASEGGKSRDDRQNHVDPSFPTICNRKHVEENLSWL